MIIVENVLPNARELRACASSWKSMARLAWVQTLSLFGVFILSFILAAIYASEVAAIWVAGTMATVLFVLIGTGMFVSAMGAAIAARAAKGRGPMRWMFDQEGVRAEGGLTKTAFKWEAVENVLEEGDRYIFALTPASNAILPRRALDALQAEALTAHIAEVRAAGRLGRGVD